MPSSITTHHFSKYTKASRNPHDYRRGGLTYSSSQTNIQKQSMTGGNIIDTNQLYYRKSKLSNVKSTLDFGIQQDSKESPAKNDHDLSNSQTITDMTHTSGLEEIHTNEMNQKHDNMANYIMFKND